MKIDGVWDETGLREVAIWFFSIAVSHVKQEYTHKLRIFLLSLSAATKKPSQQPHN